MTQTAISIHALREEGDSFDESVKTYAKEFLSTPSARRATMDVFKLLELFNISIHALREEGDLCGEPAGCYDEQFLSTPSARRATD